MCRAASCRVFACPGPLRLSGNGRGHEVGGGGIEIVRATHISWLLRVEASNMFAINAPSFELQRTS
jgi:hypothetical protein